jgi:hypothetical protein
MPVRRGAAKGEETIVRLSCSAAGKVEIKVGEGLMGMEERAQGTLCVDAGVAAPPVRSRVAEEAVAATASWRTSAEEVVVGEESSKQAPPPPLLLLVQGCQAEVGEGRKMERPERGGHCSLRASEGAGRVERVRVG